MTAGKNKSITYPVNQTLFKKLLGLARRQAFSEYQHDRANKISSDIDIVEEDEEPKDEDTEAKPADEEAVSQLTSRKRLHLRPSGWRGSGLTAGCEFGQHGAGGEDLRCLHPHLGVQTTGNKM